MEHLILKVLSFDIAVPTTNWFCERLLKLDNADAKTQSLTFVSFTPWTRHSSLRNTSLAPEQHNKIYMSSLVFSTIPTKQDLTRFKLGFVNR